MILTVGGITLGHHLTGQGVIDSSGVEWIATDIAGWWGSPAPRNVRTDRLSADGAHRSAAFRSPRIVVVEGVLVAPDDTTKRIAEQKVAGLFSDPQQLYPLAVQDETGTYSADVELNGEILTAPRSFGSVSFSVPMAAPDPRRFGSWVTASTSLGVPGVGGISSTAPGISSTAPGISAGTSATPGTVSVVNAGTAAVGPVFGIRGGVQNPVITDVTSGGSVSFTGTVSPGDTLWINTDDMPLNVPGVGVLPGRAVLLGGYSSRRAQVAVSGGWPLVSPGVTSTYLFTGISTGGTPSLSVSYRSAWR
jgi:hypothetical protein